MRPRHITDRSFMLTLTAAALVLVSPPGARGAVSEWCGTSGLLPSDESIPERDRFVLLDKESFASLNNGVLEIDDTVDELRIAFVKEDVEFPPDGEWAFQVELRMISHLRQTLDFGALVALEDGARLAQFGVARGGIGFIDFPATQWIENTFVPMDTTDATHAYRVVKTGDGGNATIEVFVDDDPTPVLTVPYEILHPSGAVRLVLSATSIVGTARFDVRCFAFNTNGTGVVPCPGDVDYTGAVDFGDILAILSAWGNKGGPEDLDGNGVVDFGDLLIVLAAWGPCP